MPASVGRQLAIVPNGLTVCVDVVHEDRHECGVVQGSNIVWRNRRYGTASSAARAMRGDDSKQVNGWKTLYIDFPDGRRMTLLDAYDTRTWPA